MDKYIFKEYSEEYPLFFHKEKERILDLVGDVPIEHIGSTAVPGLGGKGILDIAVGVPAVEFPRYKELLESYYEFRDVASTDERLFFRKDYGFGRVHIHLTDINSEDWDNALKFRDYLREHLGAVSEYSRIKQEAVNVAKGEGDVYRKYKEAFIEKIIGN